MWRSEPFPSDVELRQGDALRGIPFPKLDRDPALLDRAAIVLHDTKDCLVVSQCCTIEQEGVVAIAPIGTILERKQRPEYLEKLRAEEPQAGETFLTRYMLLGAHPELDKAAGQLRVVDLSRVITLVREETSELRRQRIASMTPAGRRLVRIKLAAFWARPEDDDLIELGLEGLPALASAEQPGSPPAS